jgi:NAD(P)-dependent dehydrogenase (short-subunit alcohol dehydrogenase family)
VLAGKVIALTGAAGSLGAALAARFLAEGAELLVLGDIDQDRVESLAASLGDRGLGLATDVTDAASVDSLVAAATARAGRLDVMVNNAGVLNPNGRIHNLTDADWERVIAVNLMGTVHGIRAAIKVMRGQSTGGAIVNTASAAGLTAWPYVAPYAATKAAVIHLTRVAAVEYAKERIRCNCVCPGTFLSQIHEGLPREALDAIAARHPLGLGQVEDLLGAFVYLASDGARWTTGAALVVDGGYSAP